MYTRRVSAEGGIELQRGSEWKKGSEVDGREVTGVIKVQVRSIERWRSGRRIG